MNNTTKEKVLFPFWLIGLEIIGIFTNNHPALFIADYYIFFLPFICLGIINIMRKEWILYNNEVVRFSVFLLLLLIVESLFHFNYLDVGTLLSYVVWFAVLICASQFEVNQKTIRFLIQCFFIASIILALMVILFKVEYVYQGSGRGTIQFFNNVQIDPNYLANYMFVGFSLELYLLQSVSEQRKRMVIFFFEMIILYAIVLTGSRAGLLCALISTVGFILQSSKDMKTKYKYIILFLFPFLFMTAFYLIIHVTPNNLLSRFAIFSLKDSSNSRRIDHWYHALRASFHNPLGYGAMHTVKILSKYTNSIADAHNTFLTIQLQFGVLGIIRFLVFLRKICKKLFYKNRFFWISFILAFCLNNFIIANHLGISFWLVLLILYYIQLKDGRNLKC